MFLGSSRAAFCRAPLAAPGNVTHPFPTRALISLFSGSISIKGAAPDELRPQEKVRFDKWKHRRAVLPSGAFTLQEPPLSVCSPSVLPLSVPPLPVKSSRTDSDPCLPSSSITRAASLQPLNSGCCSVSKSSLESPFCPSHHSHLYTLCNFIHKKFSVFYLKTSI